MIIDGMLVTEAQARTNVPYRAHTGKFIVDIGNGTDQLSGITLMQEKLNWSD